MERPENHPSTEFNGRQYTAEIEFYLPVDATEREIQDWLKFELGGGEVSNSNPLLDECMNDVSVSLVRAHDLWSYTDWSAAGPDGSRSGRRRIERAKREGGSDA